MQFQCRLTQRANIPQRALTAVLSVSCVVAVLLNNSRMVFGPYLNGQSNPAERALRSALTAAQQVNWTPGLELRCTPWLTFQVSGLRCRIRRTKSTREALSATPRRFGPSEYSLVFAWTPRSGPFEQKHFKRQSEREELTQSSDRAWMLKRLDVKREERRYGTQGKRNSMAKTQHFHRIQVGKTTSERLSVRTK